MAFRSNIEIVKICEADLAASPIPVSKGGRPGDALRRTDRNTKVTQSLTQTDTGAYAGDDMLHPPVKDGECLTSS